MRVFLAGATGVVGVRLVPLLVAAGYAVTATKARVELHFDPAFRLGI